MATQRHDEARPAFEDLWQLVSGCKECDLWNGATQSVFGEGPVPASMMLVGEQPGDQEDRQGRPFVGPAGRVLDQVLDEAGIGRDQVYLTNAVKHFKWKAKGQRRIHDTPNRTEVAACRPWLDRELDLVQPEVLVLLGATAAQAVLGTGFRVTRSRGVDLRDTGLAPHVVATAHPSTVLRAPSAAERQRATQLLVRDLQVAGALRRAAFSRR